LFENKNENYYHIENILGRVPWTGLEKPARFPETACIAFIRKGE
jgi:hypothetical protein